MSAPPILRPLGFGEVLDSAFTLYRRNFASFVAAALVPTLVMIAGALLTGMHRMNPEAPGFGFLVFMVIALATSLVMWGALAHLASRAYGGTPAQPAEGLQVALRRFFPLLGAVLLSLLALMVIGGALMVVVGIVVAIAGVAVGETAMLVFVVLLGIVMLAVYALGSAVFFAVVPAVVVEEKGPAGSISRSIELARGALPRIVGMLLVSFFIVYLPVLGVMVLTGTFSTLYDPSAAAAAAGSTAYMLQQFLSWIAGALTTPFLISVIVVQYYDRRVRTEALDVQAMTERLAMA
jgi:hypothetical protein